MAVAIAVASCRKKQRCSIKYGVVLHGAGLFTARSLVRLFLSSCLLVFFYILSLGQEVIVSLQSASVTDSV
jgi:hypothetical protein